MTQVKGTTEFIPYGKQSLDETDYESVMEVLKSQWLTQGPKIAEFETAIAERVGAKYAVAVANGTAALHIACLCLGLRAGDEVITTPNTFVASANCVTYSGGAPILCDINRENYNLDSESVYKMIAVHPQPSRIKGIIPVHFGGYPCNMLELTRIAKKHNLFILEDACHALGSKWKHQDDHWVQVGSCYGSDMSIFSFHPVKHVTCGEGGVITTNRLEHYEKLMMLRNHGITKSPKYLEKNPGPWYYEMQHLGFNYRITDIQTGLGLSQLKKLDQFIVRRRAIVARYNEAFQNIDVITIPAEQEDYYSAYHLYVILIDFEMIGKTRAQVMNELSERKVGSQVHYIPIYEQPYYKSRWPNADQQFPNSKFYYDRCLSIPLYPAMSDDQVEMVIREVISVVTS